MSTHMPSRAFPFALRRGRPRHFYLLLDKIPLVIFNVHMMKLFTAFFYFFFRGLHPGITLR